MQTQVELAILDYTQIYQKLYRKQPRNFQALDTGWAMIDGKPVQIGDLLSLTARMQREYQEIIEQKREAVEKLIDWCRN